MSFWTYVKGVVFVEGRGSSQAQVQYCIDSVMNHLPKVTGSEGNMEMHAVKLDGHDCWSNFDEFYNFIPGHGIEVQHKYAIVLNGDLRDRLFEDTFKEFVAFLCRLSKRLVVGSVNVTVCGNSMNSDNWYREYHFTNHVPYHDMYDYEDQWTDMLFHELE